MLPIKTKSGWKQRTIEVEETEDHSDEENAENDDEEEQDEEMNEDVIVPGEKVSVVELYARY